MRNGSHLFPRVRKQPFVEPIDLTLSEEALHQKVTELAGRRPSAVFAEREGNVRRQRDPSCRFWTAPKAYTLEKGIA
jgi:hypothetical protein